jgi:cystathionine beta-lyase/cystathionine gamma-synthase
VRYQNESGLKIAQFLENHPAVAKVYYPGLPTHPRYQRACEFFEGCGGMVSFEVKGGLEAAQSFLEQTTLAIVAPSLGGVETLVTRPVTTTHSGLSLPERQQLGISDSLIRISVGIEATQDLIEDFDQALSVTS